MAETGNGNMLKAVNRSISKAKKDGSIDLEKHAAPIAALRAVARVMDRPGWPIVNGSYDNTSLSVYLKYCHELGFTPGNTPKKPEKKNNALEALRAQDAKLRKRVI